MTLIKLVEEYKETYPVALILDYFGVKCSAFYLHNWRNLTKDSVTDIVKNGLGIIK